MWCPGGLATLVEPVVVTVVSVTGGDVWRWRFGSRCWRCVAGADDAGGVRSVLTVSLVNGRCWRCIADGASGRFSLCSRWWWCAVGGDGVRSMVAAVSSTGVARWRVRGDQSAAAASTEPYSTETSAGPRLWVKVASSLCCDSPSDSSNTSELNKLMTV